VENFSISFIPNLEKINMAIDSLKIDSDIVADEERVPGGSTGSWLLDTGMYPMMIELAFLEKSKGGALALNIHFKSTEFNTHVREKFWVSSGDAKGNKNYYVDKDGKKHLLPGMSQANELINIVVNKDLGDLTPEQKVVKLWSYDAREEVPTKVEALTEIIGQELLVGVVKVIDNKRTQNGAGEWVPTNEKKETNEVSKFFFSDGLTLAEKKAGETETKYLDAWKQKFDGQPIDRFKPQENAPTPAALDTSSDESLFS
jgi:hypothetical protein